MALSLEELMKKMGQDHVVPTEIEVPATVVSDALSEPLEPANFDPTTRTRFPNEDGSERSLVSRSFEIDGKETLIPTVHPETGEVMSDEDAIKYYHKTGQHLGQYPTREEATAAGQQYSENQEPPGIENVTSSPVYDGKSSIYSYQSPPTEAVSTDTKGALIDASYSENPAEEGKRQQVADKLGIPAGLVTSESEAEAFRMSNTVEEYEKNFPGLSKFMSRDSQNAKLVGREVDDLKEYEERIRGLKDPTIG